MANIPFMAGKNFKAKFFIDGTGIPLNIKSFDVKANVTEIAEGICGEDRDRLQTITNYYEINLTVKAISTDVIKSLLKDSDNDDSNVEPLQKDFALIAQPNNGLTEGFCFRDMTIGAWALNVGDRKELANVTIPLRARYFKAV